MNLTICGQNATLTIINDTESKCDGAIVIDGFHEEGEYFRWYFEHSLHPERNAVYCGGLSHKGQAGTADQVREVYAAVEGILSQTQMGKHAIVETEACYMQR